MHKFAKLLLCGIYSIFKDSKIPFLFSFYSTNFSFIQKIDKSRRNFVFFSEKKFLKIFPKIKTLKDRDIKLKNNFEKKISYLQFKSNKQSSSKYRIFGKKLRFTDFAGIEEFLPEIREFIILPVINYRLFQETNLDTSKGILLKGPSGSGKTLLVHVIAGELNLPIFYLSSQKIICSVSGINGKKIQNIFKLASDNSPSILFIDEIENFAPKKESGLRDYEKNLSYQFLTLIDELKNNKEICVILMGATSFIDQVDDSIWRPGRFDNEIKFKVPAYSTRLKIINNLRTSSSFFFDFEPKVLASSTKNYLSGDLFRLISVSANLSLSRLSRTLLKTSFCEKKKKK